MDKETMIETLQAHNRAISAMQKMLFDMRTANEKMLKALNKGEIALPEEGSEIPRSEVVRVAGAVICRLNELVGRSFDPLTVNTLQLIRSRLEDGYSEADLAAVVDDKCREWDGTNFQQYLRPQTLFSDKNFESYLVEATAKRKGSALDELAQSRLIAEQERLITIEQKGVLA